MRRGVAAVTGALLVAIAWGVAAVTPTEDDIVSPFPLTAPIGAPAVGRDIAVTVLQVHRAESVSAGEWTAEGNWVVFDLDAEAVVSEAGSILRLATLEIGGLTFRASERPESIFETSLSVGIPRTGSIAFELPESVHGGTGVLRLALNSDTRLDSVIVLDADLGEIDVEPAVELLPTDWSSQ